MVRANCYVFWGEGPRTRKRSSFHGPGRGPYSVDGMIDLEWRKGHARTAFTDEKLARRAKKPIEANPTLDRDDLIAIFDNVLRYSGFVRSDQWSRARKLA